MRTGHKTTSSVGGRSRSTPSSSTPGSGRSPSPKDLSTSKKANSSSRRSSGSSRTPSPKDPSTSKKLNESKQPVPSPKDIRGEKLLTKSSINIAKSNTLANKFHHLSFRHDDAAFEQDSAQSILNEDQLSKIKQLVESQQKRELLIADKQQYDIDLNLASGIDFNDSCGNSSRYAEDNRHDCAISAITTNATYIRIASPQRQKSHITHSSLFETDSLSDEQLEQMMVAIADEKARRAKLAAANSTDVVNVRKNVKRSKSGGNDSILQKKNDRSSAVPSAGDSNRDLIRTGYQEVDNDRELERAFNTLQFDLSPVALNSSSLADSPTDKMSNQYQRSLSRSGAQISADKMWSDYSPSQNNDCSNNMGTFHAQKNSVYIVRPSILTRSVCSTEPDASSYGRSAMLLAGPDRNQDMRMQYNTYDTLLTRDVPPQQLNQKQLVSPLCAFNDYPSIKVTSATADLATTCHELSDRISEFENILSDSLEWFQPLDTISNSYVCLSMSLKSTIVSRKRLVLFDSDVVFRKIDELLSSCEIKFGQYTINKDILYNPAINMRQTIFVKFNEFNDDLVDIQTHINNTIEFSCDTVDLVMNSARSLACYANPEMETLEIDVWRSMEWQSVTDNHNLSDYTQSLMSEHGDFVMFGPTYDCATKSWSNNVCLWILYSDPIKRHFMFKPNEKRVSSHRGLPVQHYYGRLNKQNKQRFVATDTRLRESWYLTDASKDIYVGNAFFARHPTIHSGYKRRATIGPSVRSLCRDLPSKIIPDNWFVTAAHTFAEPDETTDGKHIPPIPLNEPIFETLPGAEPESYRKIGTYLNHDKSQCVAIVEITCPKMLNLIKVTQQDIVDIVGPDTYLNSINKLESPIWSDFIYKTGCTTATTRGYTHSHGSLLNPRYKGHSLYGPRCAQYIMVQSEPVVVKGQTLVHNFSEDGDSGAGVYVLVPSTSDPDSKYSAKVFGLIEGAVEFNARSGPISAIQPIHLQSLRNLALRTAHYQSKLFKAIESFVKNPYCFLCRLSRYITTFVDDNICLRTSTSLEKIILNNLLSRQKKIITDAHFIVYEKDHDYFSVEN